MIEWVGISNLWASITEIPYQGIKVLAFKQEFSEVNARLQGSRDFTRGFQSHIDPHTVVGISVATVGIDHTQLNPVATGVGEAMRRNGISAEGAIAKIPKVLGLVNRIGRKANVFPLAGGLGLCAKQGINAVCQSKIEFETGIAAPNGYVVWESRAAAGREVVESWRAVGAAGTNRLVDYSFFVKSTGTSIHVIFALAAAEV